MLILTALISCSMSNPHLKLWQLGGKKSLWCVHLHLNWSTLCLNSEWQPGGFRWRCRGISEALSITTTEPPPKPEPLQLPFLFSHSFFPTDSEGSTKPAPAGHTKIHILFKFKTTNLDYPQLVKTIVKLKGPGWGKDTPSAWLYRGGTNSCFSSCSSPSRWFRNAVAWLCSVHAHADIRDIIRKARWSRWWWAPRDILNDSTISTRGLGQFILGSLHKLFINCLL